MSIFNKAVAKYSNQGNLSEVKKGYFPQRIFSNTTSGVDVSEKKALSISAYFDGINVLTNHLAYLPFKIIQKELNGNLTEIDHDVMRLLQFSPNNYQTAFTFKKLMGVWMLNWGNAFARIERNGNKVIALHPQKPWKTKVLQNKETKEIFFKFTDEDKIYPQRDVLHFFQFSEDGVVGRSIIEYASDRFSGHLASENFGESYFRNSASIGGILSTEESLGSDPDVVNEAKSQIRDEFDVIYNGVNNSNKVAILDGNWKYDQLKVNAKDAMLLERMKFTVADVARWLGIPVSKLKENEGQAYSSRESEALNYVQDGLIPRLTIFTQEIRNKLLTEKEKRDNYIAHIDTKELLRADTQALGEFLSKLVGYTIMTPNDALRYLGMDTFEGGDVHLKALNIEILEDYEAGADEGTQNLVRELKKVLENQST